MADEKKIIIDEDWKSQVEAEKEAAKKAGSASPATAPSGTEQEEAGLADMPMPSASFEMLLTTLATEALVSMGQIPHPTTDKLHFHRHQAKYLIDTIDMLKEKTRGNLSTDEQTLVDDILHQLKIVFVESARANSDIAPSPEVEHLA